MAFDVGIIGQSNGARWETDGTDLTAANVLVWNGAAFVDPVTTGNGQISFGNQMAAAQAAWDTVEVAFLNGNQTPYQERRNQDIANDNITYKVRIDAAAAPMDFRGLYKNIGA